MRSIPVLSALAVLCACLPASAEATATVSLRAALTPQRHTRSVTVGIDFSFAAAAPSSPVTALTISYPDGLDIELGELGLDTCSIARIEAVGPRGCPANSIMGYGRALAEVQVGPEVLHETAQVTLARARQHDGRFTVLLDAEGTEPLIARVLMIGELLPAQPPFGGALRFSVPTVASVPGGPDIALVRLDLVLGPPNLVYHERLHGKTIAYHPKGITLLGACPRAGRPFSATARFLDGRSASADTTVRCRAARALPAALWHTPVGRASASRSAWLCAVDSRADAVAAYPDLGVVAAHR